GPNTIKRTMNSGITNENTNPARRSSATRITGATRTQTPAIRSFQLWVTLAEPPLRLSRCYLDEERSAAEYHLVGSGWTIDSGEELDSPLNPRYPLRYSRFRAAWRLS